MSEFFKFIGAVQSYKTYTTWGIFFHLLTALLTVVSIPLVVPFFQLLFGTEGVTPTTPQSIWDLEAFLNYNYGRLISNWDRIDALKIVCATVILVFLLKNICRFLISYFMIPVRNGILKDLRKEIWTTFQHLSLAKRNQLQQGYLNSLITNDLLEIDHGILKSFELLFKLPLIVLGSLLIMVLLNPLLTLIAFVLILFTLIIVGRLSHSLRRPASEAQDSLSAISTLVDQYLSSMKLVRSLGVESFFTSSFDTQNQAYLKSTTSILRRRDLASPLSEFLGVITIVVLLFVGTMMVLQDAMQASSFFAFIFAFYNIIDPAKSFSREYSNVQRGLAALDRIVQFKDTHVPDATDEHSDSETIPSFGEVLKIQNVSLRYDQHEVLNKISFEIRKGEKIGIVGVSGEGKSSILDAILRFYMISQGEISLDGRNIATMNLNTYRKVFALVPQETMLFHGTVQDNITLGKPMSHSKLAQVMSNANLSEDLLSHKVGDRGVMLSGGQCQRISIARALYQEPQILLMDEPTSELDAENEKEVIDAILNTQGSVSLILVSHNVSLLKNMDKIIVVSEGTIEAFGKFNELLTISKVFPRLISSD